ncbi:fungal-specific transcription factor domain-containing protein [Xylogone sp. PMI_703]|nr:fungal-specific transcription factor domain-containing protein [Xylogone sp. PMI_703]
MRNMNEPQPKRIRLACLNCRRKKTRCSGERPACAFCARLRQDCHYDDALFALPEEANLHLEHVQLPLTFLDQINMADSTFASRVASTESQSSTLDHTRLVTGLNVTYDLDILLTPNNDLSQFIWDTVTPSEWAVTSSPPIDQRDIPTLPDLEVLQSIIDTYFQYCHCQPYCYFQESSFRRRLSENTLPSWLLLAVAASALGFSDHPFYRGRQTEVSDAFAVSAWNEIREKMFSEDEFMTVYTVQATNMLSVIDFSAGRCKQAWVKIGISVRFAQGLGMFSESDTSSCLWQQEERRRTAWSVYLLDRIVSSSPDRVPTIQDADCTLHLPVDPIVYACDLFSEKKKKLTDLADNLEDLGNIGYGGLLCHLASTLGQIQRHCLRRSTQGGLPWKHNSEFAAIYSSLLICESYSPAAVTDFESFIEKACSKIQNERKRGPVLGFLCFSYALYFLCHCLLHHPFLIRHRLRSAKAPIPPSFLRDTLRRSRESATALTQLLHTLLKRRLCLASFLGYCAVVAGVTHRLFESDEDPSVRQSGRRLYQVSLQFLQQAPGRWRHFPPTARALANLNPDSIATTAMINPLLYTNTAPHPNSEDIWNLLDYSKLSEQTKQ